ncbi:putative phosphoenolpyruvate synthase [Trichonephila clavipes]|nr:putative phosphoenolpyruvate synthase [Trichonephila clavipes]
MAVVIQEMVSSEVSGVLFTCDPVTNNPSIITITANYGLGETVVSGSVEPDTFKLRRRGNEEVELDSVVVGAKHQKIVMQDSGGTITEDLDENSRKESCLSKETAERLGKLSLKIESFYKSSRDIEWGIYKDQIYILQSRPVTNIAPETDYEMKHEFDIPLRCETEYFSVANVGEVMPGASSPLGIDCLTKYFNNFFKVHAVTKGMKKSSDLLVEKYHWIFPAPFMNHMMLKVIEMIGPNGIDSQVSKGFMISMFGRILKDPEMLSYGRERFKKLVKPPLKTKLRFYWDLFTYDYKLERVKKEIDAYHLDFLKKKTAKETFAAIVRTCSDFDKSALAHVDCLTGSSMWNMIMFSILSNAKGDLDNDVYGDFAKLLATSSNVESANIPHAMQEVADQIAKDINCEEFKSMSPEQAEKWLQASTSLAGYKFRQFLKRHGHRCLGEEDFGKRNMPGKRARRHFSQLSEFERGLIIGMKTASWSMRRVAGQVDRSECAVRNCWEQWTREGTHVRRTGSGATRKTKRREDRRIVRQALVDPTVTRSTIRADVGLAIVPQTISRHLAGANLKSKRPFRALFLTPEHRQLRLQWCQARSMWNVTDWQKVVFSDESRFVLGTDDNRVRMWRRPAYDSRSPLIVIRGGLTGQRYVDDILRPHVGPFLNGLPGAIFQQDNARTHTARVAQDFLRHFQTIPWLARSPDWSPVEHVWDQLKRQMPSSHSVHDLELAVQESWAHLPQDNIRCLINSMPDRVGACIATGGGPTRY